MIINTSIERGWEGENIAQGFSFEKSGLKADSNVKQRQMEMNEMLIKEAKNGKVNFTNERTIQALACLMEQTPSLSSFFSFNHFNRKHIEKLIKHSTLLLIENGVCLFKQSTKVDEVFCLLSGKVSIKISSLSTKEDNMPIKLKKEYNLTKEPQIDFSQEKTEQPFNQMNNPLEKEGVSFLYDIGMINHFKRISCSYSRPSMIKSILYDTTEPIFTNITTDSEMNALTLESQGFFCEWNMLNHLPHCSSAYSQGQCLLLCLNEVSFKKSIERPLFYSYQDKKDFIRNRLKTLRELSMSQFDELFLQFNWVYPAFNEVIITKEELQSYFYIIYLGQCSIQPKAFNKKILHFQTGDFLGLEVFFSSNSIDQFTLTSSAYNTILIQCDIKLLNPILMKELKEELRPYYHARCRIIAKIVKDINSVNKKIKHSYQHILHPLLITNTNLTTHRRLIIYESQGNDKKAIAFTTQDKGNAMLNKRLFKNELKLKKKINHFSLQRKKVSRSLIAQINTTNNYINTISNANTEEFTEVSLMSHNEAKRPITIQTQSKLSKLVMQNSNVGQSMKQHIPLPIRRDGVFKQAPTKHKLYYSTRVSPSKFPLNNKKERFINHNHSLSTVRSTLEEQVKYSSIELKLFQKPIKPNKLKKKTVMEKLLGMTHNWTKTMNNPKRPFLTSSYNIPLLTMPHSPFHHS